MDKLRNRREGFSLIEMIIAIAIIGIVMSGVILLISYSTNSMKRTTNSVNLQNQTKDAITHMTTYLQEGSDAKWVSEQSALIIPKFEKDYDGNIVGMDVGYYWFTQDPTVTTEKRGDIKFYKTHYPITGVLEMSDIVAADGTINYDVLSPPEKKDNFSQVFSSGSSTQDSLLFAKNVIDFDCDIVDNTIDGSMISPPAVYTSPSAVRIGGKYVVLTLEMQNEEGDAHFKSTKEVFLRNN